MEREDGLKAVGFWAQYSGDDSELPWPARLVDTTWDIREAETVAKYLDAGTVETQYRGYSFCRFNPNADRESQCATQKMGSCDLTDGVYTWPEGYSHYVRHHKVKPPQEFLDHVRKRLSNL